MEWKRISVVFATAALALTTAAACSSSGGGNGGTPVNTGGGNTGGGSSTPAPSGVPDPAAQPASKITPVTMSGDCADYGKYGHYDGATVTIYTSITEPEIGYHIKSVKQFEKCTGIDVQYQPSKEFEAALKTKVDGGNAPDLAIFPQPGLLQTFAKSGDLKLASDALTTEAEANWVPSWVGYGSVLNHFFGAPLGANLKSLIWYSPKYFKQWGYTIPTTWDELIAASDKAAADGHKPWCLGIESGDATGWVLTDWMEEVMLRKYGPDVYDQWTQHKIPFNDPKVLDVLQTVGSIVKNTHYVNAGIGDVKSIATTPFQEGGLPVAKGDCVFHAQANFYAANWPAGTKVAEDGDVFAFYEPTMSEDFGKVVEVGGEFVGAFNDAAQVEAVQLYLASGEWATEKAQLNAAAHSSGWATANQAVDASVFVDPIDKLSVSILTDPSSTARFDASDVMPSDVGAGSFWKQMTQWILGQSDQATLDAIESSWPQ
ncbi:MAG: alpha-glucoside transport system substrate-binding protein [Pseudonocardiales bacterium]|jgi:alpha-glucoside transport system substrate-binding protein|nr:alpha-glucoside transport system substrate-binding protein [Pseudonocardiales bacterium]